MFLAGWEVQMVNQSGYEFRTRIKRYAVSLIQNAIYTASYG